MKRTRPDYLKTAVAAARAAGAILAQNFGKTHRIYRKGRIDIVTDIDRRSEEAVISVLRRKFPDHNILAEESPAIDRRSPYTWIVDPLDGTTNYAHAYPFYAVSIALARDKEPFVGVVFHPEMGELFCAVKGGGAFLNNKRIRPSQIDRLDRALLVTGFPYDIAENPGITFALFEQMCLSAQGMRRDGSAALNLCYVACGRFDGFWEEKLKPWDTAAGALIAREAGAVLTDYAGHPYSCFMNELLAGNKPIHADMLSIVKRVGNARTNSGLPGGKRGRG